MSVTPIFKKVGYWLLANNYCTKPHKAACEVDASPISVRLNYEAWSSAGSSLRLSHRPAAGGRAREDSPGEEPGAGAGPAADVLQQPGTAAGDRGKEPGLRNMIDLLCLLLIFFYPKFTDEMNLVWFGPGRLGKSG